MALYVGAFPTRSSRGLVLLSWQPLLSGRPFVCERRERKREVWRKKRDGLEEEKDANEIPGMVSGFRPATRGCWVLSVDPLLLHSQIGLHEARGSAGDAPGAGPQQSFGVPGGDPHPAPPVHSPMQGAGPAAQAPPWVPSRRGSSAACKGERLLDSGTRVHECKQPTPHFGCCGSELFAFSVPEGRPHPSRDVQLALVLFLPLFLSCKQRLLGETRQLGLCSRLQNWENRETLV